MTGEAQRAESLPVGTLLALVGGYLDAYTFLAHGGVFATAQTGNVILLGVDLAQRRWSTLDYRLLPIAAFLAGVGLAGVLAKERDGSRVPRVARHPARLVLVLEVCGLLAVGFAPVTRTWDAPVGAAVGLVAGLQLEAFRSVDGSSYATMMTTSNVRQLVDDTVQWAVRHDPEAGRHARDLACVVLFFALGGLAGALVTARLAGHAVWVAAAPLALVLVLLVHEPPPQTGHASAVP